VGVSYAVRAAGQPALAQYGEDTGIAHHSSSSSSSSGCCNPAGTPHTQRML
jgi:hypothetical protein